MRFLGQALARMALVQVLFHILNKQANSAPIQVVSFPHVPKTNRLRTRQTQKVFTIAELVENMTCFDHSQSDNDVPQTKNQNVEEVEH
jgi:hypothetical protein